MQEFCSSVYIFLVKSNSLDVGIWYFFYTSAITYSFPFQYAYEWDRVFFYGVIYYF